MSIEFLYWGGQKWDISFITTYLRPNFLDLYPTYLDLSVLGEKQSPVILRKGAQFEHCLQEQKLLTEGLLCFA